MYRIIYVWEEKFLFKTLRGQSPIPRKMDLVTFKGERYCVHAFSYSYEQDFSEPQITVACEKIIITLSKI